MQTITSRINSAVKHCREFGKNRLEASVLFEASEMYGLPIRVIEQKVRDTDAMYSALRALRSHKNYITH